MPEVFAEFIITYLTETVHMMLDLANDRVNRNGGRERGLVKYKVYAKNAEDAIRRLREQEPIEHPIIEIAAVVATGEDSSMLILPIEWGLGNAGSGKLRGA